MLCGLQVWTSLKNIVPAPSPKNLTLSTAQNAACQIVTYLNAGKPEDKWFGFKSHVLTSCSAVVSAWVFQEATVCMAHSMGHFV